MSIPELKVAKTDVPSLVQRFLCAHSLQGVEFVICGSHRRNAPVSNDIDLVLVYDELQTFTRIAAGCTRAFGSLRGSCSPKLIGRFEGVKFDVKPCIRKRLGAMLLHATGSWQFNRWLRFKAKLRGQLLNQYGLYAAESKAMILESEHEKDFFDVLDTGFVEPQDRNGEFYECLF